MKEGTRDGWRKAEAESRRSRRRGGCKRGAGGAYTRIAEGDEERRERLATRAQGYRVVHPRVKVTYLLRGRVSPPSLFLFLSWLEQRAIYYRLPRPTPSFPFCFPDPSPFRSPPSPNPLFSYFVPLLCCRHHSILCFILLQLHLTCFRLP